MVSEVCPWLTERAVSSYYIEKPVRLDKEKISSLHFLETGKIVSIQNGLVASALFDGPLYGFSELQDARSG
jgi:hypothetical protein